MPFARSCEPSLSSSLPPKSNSEWLSGRGSTCCVIISECEMRFFWRKANQGERTHTKCEGTRSWRRSIWFLMFARNSERVAPLRLWFVFYARARRARCSGRVGRKCTKEGIVVLRTHLFAWVESCGSLINQYPCVINSCRDVQGDYPGRANARLRYLFDKRGARWIRTQCDDMKFTKTKVSRHPGRPRPCQFTKKNRFKKFTYHRRVSWSTANVTDMTIWHTVTRTPRFTV